MFKEAKKGDPDQANRRLAAIKPFPMLDIDDEARSLAEKIITKRAIPAEYPEDALHTAVAAVNGIEVVLSRGISPTKQPVHPQESETDCWG